MADELVFKPQGVVEHARVPKHDRVVERSAQRQALLTQHLDFLQEPERASRRDLLDERLFRHANGSRLVSEERMIEADAVRDLEVIGGVQRDPLVALRQRNRPDHFQVLPRRGEPLHARLVHEIHK